jgi:hypothetical protein
MKNSDKLALRKRIPYVLDIYENEVYYINRDYEYIGLDTKVLSTIREDSNDFKRTYIYNDGSKPWESKTNYIKAVLYSKEDDEIYRGRIGKEDEIEDSDEEGVVMKTAREQVVTMRREQEKAMALKDKAMEELKESLRRKEEEIKRLIK